MARTVKSPSPLASEWIADVSKFGEEPADIILREFYPDVNGGGTAQNYGRTLIEGVIVVGGKYEPMWVEDQWRMVALLESAPELFDALRDMLNMMQNVVLDTQQNQRRFRYMDLAERVERAKLRGMG